MKIIIYSYTFVVFPIWWFLIRCNTDEIVGFCILISMVAYILLLKGVLNEC